MACVGARSVHDNGVNTIKSGDGDEVARLNQALIVFINVILSFSLSKIVSHKLIKELNICVLHIRGNVGAENRIIGVGAEAANESLE